MNTDSWRFETEIWFSGSFSAESEDDDEEDSGEAGEDDEDADEDADDEEDSEESEEPAEAGETEAASGEEKVWINLPSLEKCSK